MSGYSLSIVGISRPPQNVPIWIVWAVGNPVPFPSPVTVFFPAAVAQESKLDLFVLTFNFRYVVHFCTPLTVLWEAPGPVTAHPLNCGGPEGFVLSVTLLQNVLC